MGRFQKGQSGNPAGRPPKNRSLTDLLEKAGDVTIHLEGETRRVARKRLVAELVWRLATEGKATMPDGTVLRLDPKDWINTVRWIYQHIDGPPTAALDLTTGGDKIAVIGLGVNTDDL